MALLETVPKPVSSLQKAARLHLDTVGLPTKKTEAWRFTSPKAIVEASYESAAVTVHVQAPEGVCVERLSATDVPAELGSVAPNEAFVALNNAAFEEAVVLRAKGASKEPVLLRYESERSDGVVHPRVLIVAEAHAELRVQESFEGCKGLVNSVTEVLLRPGAIVDHCRLHQGSEKVIGFVAVHQQRDSQFRSHAFSLGGELTRLDFRLALAEPGSRCDVQGAYHVAGNEHVDVHIYADHIAPHCFSNQNFRGVLEDKAVAVFDGQAIVRQSAPSSEAHQSNKNLLLSDGATVHTKPHLEIENDDVVASHGATVGALNEDEVFYLRARGVPEGLARAILTDAFVQAIVDDVPDEALRASLKEQFRGRLRDGATIAAFDGEWEDE